MSHAESHPPAAVAGITRRAVLRRAVVTGGTLAWSAPLVQSLGASAAAATVSPAPGAVDVHGLGDAAKDLLGPS